ncbi:MAG: glutamate--tRNA ligase [Gammaproteobacteria bacterium]|nr:glutamate--tRNA ligase [Gammaproteobacteria bacterium]
MALPQAGAPAPAAPVTRFAPSPTGELHLGNARTALFNWLLARGRGGRFLLRIEDTDAGRSRTEYATQILDDLRWLGLDWDGDIVVQSARGPAYAEALARLEADGRAYPCYCTPVEIEVSRRSQLAAGRPPRYAGTCRHLDAHQRAARLAEGRQPTLRFRVPDAGRIAFTDLVHGEQVFDCADIGDFVLRRADHSAAFFFSNILDDADSGVTVVLRGEDHLSNTPRQLLIAEALGLRAPAYGHLSLITGPDGAPLSKRLGAKTLRELRETGFLPVALVNHLYRLGHSGEAEGLQHLDALARAFDTTRLVRSPARFDPAQLESWQKAAVQALTPEAALEWLRPALPAGLAPAAAQGFVDVIRHNLALPAELAPWSAVVFGELPPPAAAEQALLAEAGPEFFAAAAAALRDRAAGLAGGDPAPWKAATAAIAAATGRKGPALFKPLRVALTGQLQGPELAPLIALMTPARAIARLERLSSRAP